MTTFDTLHYAKKLKEAGFSEQQAETQAEALRAVVDENLATKTDLKEIESPLARDIELVRSNLRQTENPIARVFELLRRDMRAMESRITLRLGLLIVGADTALGVLMKLT